MLSLILRFLRGHFGLCLGLKLSLGGFREPLLNNVFGEDLSKTRWPFGPVL